MIKLNLSSLIHAVAGHQAIIEVKIDRVCLEDIELQHLHGELTFTRVVEGLAVEGELDAKAKVACTRCLTSFYEPIKVEFDDIISLPGADLTLERPVRIREDGWVDLAPLVREHAWLGLPVNSICSPTCLGLCPDCGGNRNLGECTCEEEERIDPRLEALRALVEDDPGAG
jgi:uncharacterized protein